MLCYAVLSSKMLCCVVFVSLVTFASFSQPTKHENMGHAKSLQTSGWFLVFSKVSFIQAKT